jgi:hypothetical protein
MGSFDRFSFEAEDTEGVSFCTLASSSTTSSLESDKQRLRQANPQKGKENSKIKRVAIGNLRVRIQHGKQRRRWL